MKPIPIRPFNLSVPQSELDSLQSRLDNTRWSPPETTTGWIQGVPLNAMKELHRYWKDNYDWRKCERWFNSYPNYRASIDGEEIHIIHIKSSHEDALPMLLIHGWPGSVLEFRKVIQTLVEPEDGAAGNSFHLVIPSLPGYGWSSKPKSAGWNLKRISDAFVALMLALGYTSFVAQGGDWGADIVALMASDNPPASLAAIHMNSAFFDAQAETVNGEPSSAGEELALEEQRKFRTDGYGYFLQQRTRPQTLAYLLTDSPVGQAAWIYEKPYSWTQHNGSLYSVLTKDEILDNIMVYWLSNSRGSSARLYWEDDDNTALPINIPVGVSIFPGDLTSAPRAWGRGITGTLCIGRDVEKGGHFAAWEVPEIFVREVRESFRHVR